MEDNIRGSLCDFELDTEFFLVTTSKAHSIKGKNKLDFFKIYKNCLWKIPSGKGTETSRLEENISKSYVWQRIYIQSIQRTLKTK